MTLIPLVSLSFCSHTAFSPQTAQPCLPNTDQTRGAFRLVRQSWVGYSRNPFNGSHALNELVHSMIHDGMTDL